MVRLAVLVGWPFVAIVAVWLALLTMAGAAGPAEASLLANGGFEDGDTGWTVIGGSIAIIETANSPALVAAGARAGKLTIDADQNSLRAAQAVPVQPGGSYVLSGQALIDDPNVSSALLQLSWFSPAAGQEHADTAHLTGVTGSYQQLSTPVVVIPCDAMNAQVAIVVQRSPLAATAQAYFDDLRLKSTGAGECPTTTPSPTASPTASDTPTRTATGVPTETATRTSTATRTVTLTITPTDTRTPTPTRTETSTRTPTPTTTAAALVPTSTVTLPPATQAPPTPSNGLLVNGGFEAVDGDGIAGWRTFGGELTLAAWPVHGGSAAGCLRSTTSTTKWVFQTVAVQPSWWYELDGYIVQDDAMVEAAWLRASWYGSVDGSGSALSTVDSTALLEQPEPGFRYLTTGKVQAPSDAHSANARIMLRPVSDAAAMICIDDVSFDATGGPTVTPTPTSTASATPTPATLWPTATLVVTATPTQLAVATTSPTPGDGPQPVEATATRTRAAAATATTTAPLPADGDLLANGGFEDAPDGELDGWSKYGGLLTRVDDPVHGGQFAGALFSSSSSTKWAYQTVAVTPMQWYQMEGFVHHDHPGVESAWLRVSWYGSADGTGSALASVDSLTQLDGQEAGYRWLNTGPVQAPPGAQSAKARVMLRPRSEMSALVYIDDVSFRPVAPPDVPAGAVETPADDGSEETYVPPRRSTGSGVVSQVLGGQVARLQQLVPQATPVIRRDLLLVPKEDPSIGGGADRTWLWTVAAAIAAAGLAGSAAYRWGRGTRAGAVPSPDQSQGL